MSDGLTPKQAAFVHQYLVDKNGTQAAIRVGYSRKTAESQASRLLRNAKVKAAVEAGLALQAEESGITAQRVLEEIGKIAFVPLDDVALLEAAEDEDSPERVLVVRVPDKLKALELLGKNLKLFVDKVEHKHGFADLTDEQLQSKLDGLLVSLAAST